MPCRSLRYVGLTHALDLVFVALDGVEKSQRARSSAVCSVEQEGVRFDNNHVRSNQLPSLLACLGEERPGSLVVEILWDKNREESTGVDEDGLHRTLS
jgi:hypothetical protein